MKYVKPKLNTLKIQSVVGRTCALGSNDKGGGIGSCKNGPAPTGTCKTGTSRK